MLYKVGIIPEDANPLIQGKIYTKLHTMDSVMCLGRAANHKVKGLSSSLIELLEEK
jgi:hypothetical protein